jgi:hypothetical protein
LHCDSHSRDYNTVLKHSVSLTLVALAASLNLAKIKINFAFDKTTTELARQGNTTSLYRNQV